MKHIMTLAAQKARDALIMIQPSELKDDDPNILCEARAMTLRSIARAVWYQDWKTAKLLANDTTAGATHLQITLDKISIANDESFAQEVDTTHLAIANRRRQDAAARSGSAYLDQNRQLGDKWRQKSRRAAQRGELWKPFAKRLILAGVRVAEGASFHIVTDPMAMHSAIQTHWSRVFSAKDVNIPDMQQYLDRVFPPPRATTTTAS